MCRSADYHGFHASSGDRLKIKGFFLHFSRLKSQKPLPQSLTLLYLPRIDETALEIDGTKIRPDSPAFVTLHRVVWPAGEKDAVFGSRERVRASEGVQFQVYLREEKVMQGTFRKDEDGEWRLQCKCTLETEIVGAEASIAKICVAVEGRAAMFERVALLLKRKKNRSFDELEEIPEGREEDDDPDDCRCSGRETGSTSDGGDWEGGDDTDAENGDGERNAVEREMEGGGWAVDLGIWAVFLGVGLGYWVSRAAAAKALRRRKFSY